jgi:hypothetical protein
VTTVGLGRLGTVFSSMRSSPVGAIRCEPGNWPYDREPGAGLFWRFPLGNPSLRPTERGL